MRTIEGAGACHRGQGQTTHDHLQRVRVYAVEVAKELNVDREGMDALQAAALLHDIGSWRFPSTSSRNRPADAGRIREDEDSSAGGS